MEELQLFKNEDLELQIRAMKNEDGNISVNLEDVARGLGFVDNSKLNSHGENYIRWNTVRKYLCEFGISQQVAKDTLIPESVFYLLAMKASNEVAKKFQVWVATDVLPTIRKTGGYVTNETQFVDYYFPEVDDDTKSFMVVSLQQIKKKNEIIEQQKKEIEYKEDIIIGLVDDISVADKRQILNRVVRRGGAKKIKDRWNALYREFDNKYHIDVSRRWENYNENHKPKIKNKLDYIDKVMDKVPELYDIAVKLYENDVKELVQEMYELNNIKNEVATYGN